ncbi:MAG: hypothetical protein CVV42_15050 [Candidatus Riflebacteria bacterium HGW-Riflebacteria-2]|jgi:hypothetical protein|nr:MAG: hypothetical protein CVV42_15050 [Candidatus Riflebacteria bacterium HGW-Riflebacteria-2]
MLRKPVILLFCLVVLALAITGCGSRGGDGSSTGNPAGPAITGETANLNGTVLFESLPLANVAVYLYKSEKAPIIGMTQLPAIRSSLIAQQLISDGAYSTSTNETGVYSFSDIPVGQYTLIAVKDENHQFAQTGVLLGQVTTLNPHLTPTGKIGGRVTSTIGASEQGVGGAFVYVSGTSYISLTNAAGYFVINSVPSNSLAGSTAYGIQVMPGKGTASPVTGVIVNPGETTNIGTITLSQQETGYKLISGKFIAGAGVANAELADQFVIMAAETDGTLIGSSSDNTGNFSFFVNRTGSYHVIPTDTFLNFAPASQTVTVTALDDATINLADFVVSRVLEGGSVVAGTVTWPTITDWNFIDGEMIIEGTTTAGAAFVGRSITSNQSPATFRFDNVPSGTYVLKTNPLRNGYAGTTAAFTVTQGVDLTNRSLATSFIAPFITTTTTANDLLTLAGNNFGTDVASLMAFVNDKPVTLTLDGPNIVLDIAQIPPGEQIVQLVKILPEGRLAGNKKPFTRPVRPPLLASFNASSTDTSITFNWQNAPYVKEVDIRLLQGATVVKTFQRIIGNSFTYEKLQPGVTYTINVISTYPNLTSPAATAYPFSTKADSINLIPSYAFLPGTGTIATGTVFGFEIVNGIAYVGFDNSGPITIQSFNLATNELVYTSSQILTSSDHPMRSMSANSNGVYLTYANTNASPTIAVFNPPIVAPAQTVDMTTSFSLTPVADMATVRCLNNRIFLVSAQGTYPITTSLFELSSSLSVLESATPISGNSNPYGKMADIAYDRTTGTLFLACPNGSNVVSLQAFSAMVITSSPQLVGDFAASNKEMLGLYANNGKAYLSQSAVSGMYHYPLTTTMETGSGYINEIYSTYPGSFGFDKQNRVWGGSLYTPFEMYYLFQYDNAMNVLQSLKIYNADYIALNLPMIRLDESTGNMYMLHFNASNQLAVYKYNSNY